MVDATEPPAGDASDRSEASTRPRSTARKLDRRTIAICACIALVAALAAGLVTSILIGEDGGRASDGMSLTKPVDMAKVLAQPVQTVDGKPTTLGNQLEQKPAVVNFWQSSCLPCIDEMPLLEQGQADNPDITFVGVSTIDRLPQAKVRAKQTGITYPWLQDPSGELYYEAQGAGMPTTILISADGKLLAAKTGPFTNADQLQAFLDKAS